MKNLICYFDFIFPSRCPLCDEVKLSRLLICDDCREKYYDNIGIESILPGEIQCISAYPYYDIYKKSVLRLKYGNNKRLGIDMGGLIYEAIKKFSDESFDYVTDVPASKSTLRKRGYNQSKYLAFGIEKSSNIKYVSLLKKPNKSIVQHSLSRKMREINVKNTYFTTGYDIKDKSIIIVDDVCTTGFTLSECAKVLLENGAKKVLCVSYTKTLY